MAGTLYLVPTPIGNLGDLSDRCRETLAAADLIAAEDTRVTRKLLSHLDLHVPMVSYYEHNRIESGERILARLLTGENCALVTDAGTPAISDPGEDLVAKCAAADVPVVSVPGPCALITALTVSGQPASRFTFEGFLSTNRKNRSAHLDSLRSETRTMIFYEAPHKLLDTLADMAAVFGAERPVSLCRELTKLHEEVLRTTFAGALAHYAEQAPPGRVRSGGARRDAGRGPRALGGGRRRRRAGAAGRRAAAERRRPGGRRGHRPVPERPVSGRAGCTGRAEPRRHA